MHKNLSFILYPLKWIKSPLRRSRRSPDLSRHGDGSPQGHGVRGGVARPARVREGRCGFEVRVGNVVAVVIVVVVIITVILAIVLVMGGQMVAVDEYGILV